MSLSFPMSSAPSASMSTSSGRTMRQQSDCTPTSVGLATDSFLRRLYPRDTAKMVAGDTGIPVATVEKMLERRSAPGPATWPLLAWAYGPDFLRAVLPDCPAWLDKAVRLERQAQLDAKIASLVAEREALR